MRGPSIFGAYPFSDDAPKMPKAGWTPPDYCRAYDASEKAGYRGFWDIGDDGDFSLTRTPCTPLVIDVPTRLMWHSGRRERAELALDPGPP
jgi:hypothetical protein